METQYISQKSNGVLIFPLITFVVFIITGISSIITGIEHHKTWRIVTASVGVALFLFLTVMTVWAVIKNWKSSIKQQ
jgi:hypothetical protein